MVAGWEIPREASRPGLRVHRGTERPFWCTARRWERTRSGQAWLSHCNPVVVTALLPGLHVADVELRAVEPVRRVSRPPLVAAAITPAELPQ